MPRLAPLERPPTNCGNTIEAIHDGHLPSDVNPQPRVSNSPTVPRGEMGRRWSMRRGVIVASAKWGTLWRNDT
jgi:hypothetical protein